MRSSYHFIDLILAMAIFFSVNSYIISALDTSYKQNQKRILQCETRWLCDAMARKLIKDLCKDKIPLKKGIYKNIEVSQKIAEYKELALFNPLLPQLKDMRLELLHGSFLKNEPILLRLQFIFDPDLSYEYLIPLYQ